MDFILSQGGQNLRLPVPPEKFEVQTGNLNTVVTVEQFGELQLMGKSKLTGITIESFWPANKYSFCKYDDYMIPYAAMGIINEWKDSGVPIQVIITGTPFNMTMSIDSFNYGEKDGTRDVYFSISFKEYKYVSLQSATISNFKTYIAISTFLDILIRAFRKEIPHSYTVVKGDTLMKIAQKVYGDSSKWRELYSKNSCIIKNPNLIFPGQVLTL